ERRRDVDVLDRTAEDRVAHAAADEARLGPAAGERFDDRLRLGGDHPGLGRDLLDRLHGDQGFRLGGWNGTLGECAVSTSSRKKLAIVRTRPATTAQYQLLCSQGGSGSPATRARQRRQNR